MHALTIWQYTAIQKMIESTETAFDNVETSPLDGGFHVSTVSSDSNGPVDALPCSSTTTTTEPLELKLLSEPCEQMKNRRCFTKVIMFE